MEMNADLKKNIILQSCVCVCVFADSEAFYPDKAKVMYKHAHFIFISSSLWFFYLSPTCIDIYAKLFFVHLCGLNVSVLLFPVVFSVNGF